MRARRTDANHEEIAKAFEKLGCRVHRTNADWDLTAQYGGLTLLIEVKNPKSHYGRKGFNKRQKSIPVMRRIVSSVEDVAEAVDTLRKWHFAIRSVNPSQTRQNAPESLGTAFMQGYAPVMDPRA